MAMNLDEAIKHAEEKGHGDTACAADHRQLAVWLKDYQKDKERLDHLDNLNKALNERTESLYGWKLDVNHLRVQLSDSHCCPVLPVREAIDNHMVAERRE